MVIKKSYEKKNHFISKNTEVAFAWAGYFTMNKECIRINLL